MRSKICGLSIILHLYWRIYTLKPQNLLSFIISLSLIVWTGHIVRAVPLTIDTAPQETSGPFVHNVFHAASSVTSGSILAWFDLNPTRSNWYDAATGALEVHTRLFADAALTSLIGTATGTSTNLVASDFNDFDGSVLGTITWEFTLMPGTFLTYMQTHFGSGSTFTVTMTYLDKNYVTSSAGYTANSWDNGVLTLWGADGYSSGSFVTPKLGSDVVLHTVPEPSTLLLLGSALVGLGILGRWQFFRVSHR